MSVSAAQVDRSTGQAFVTSLVTNAAILAIQVGAFSLLKDRMSRIYSPRTFLPPPIKRAEEFPSGLWRWLPATIKAPTDDIINVNGLDAYLFLRFLKILVIIFFVHTIATFAIILPINSVRVENGQVGMNRFNWENLTLSSQQNRFSAHIIVVYILTTFVVLLIRREMMHFVFMQQRFLISKSHSRLAQARTVLITSVPDDLGSEEAMRLFTGFVPGGIDRIWFFRDTKELNKLFQKRQDACARLESAISTVLRQATKNWQTTQSRHRKEQRMKTKDEEGHGSSGSLHLPKPSKTVLNDLVPPEKHPKRRTHFMGLFGKKVDTIDHCKDEIAHLNVVIADKQKHIVRGKFLGSVFIRCNLQMGAHVLAQCVSHHKPFRMYDKWLEAHPKDIVWENLGESAVATRTRTILSWLLTFALIVVWVFPVGFVGTLSNVSSLCTKVSSLSWICKAHAPIPGIIQGVVPPILLAAFFAILPFIFYALAWYECIPRYSLISLSIYRRFFLFLVIHGFLIVTLTSGITGAIVEIARNPASAVQTLASRLSGASTFFLTYMVTQGLAGAGIVLTQLLPILFYYIRKVFFGRTPRQAFEVTYVMPFADFGVVLPMYSLLATIGFAYSVISPLINALAFLSFCCIYIVWKYLIIQVLDQPDEMETSGRYFQMAMSRLFVGLYVEQICLACLFFLKISISRIPSIVDAATMVALLILTIYAHVMIYTSFKPITDYLPMTLATSKLAKRYDRAKKKRETEHKARDDMFGLGRLMSVRKRLSGRRRRPDPRDQQLPVERITEDTEVDEEVKDLDKEDEQIPIPGPSDHHPPRAPELFRHLSLPVEDRYDLYDRPKLSVKFNSTPETRDDIQVHAHSAPGDRRKPEEHAKDDGKLKLAGEDNPDEEDEDEDEDEDEEELQDEADFDEHAFDHPSTYKAQPWVWIPRDALGLSGVLVEELTSVGISASDEGAVMDERGIVEVLRGPPDEEWLEGIDR